MVPPKTAKKTKPRPRDLVAYEVKPDWRGQTCLVCASGPTLASQLEAITALRGRVRVITVNKSWEALPWADATYATDASFWTNTVSGLRCMDEFEGLKFTSAKTAAKTFAARGKALNYIHRVRQDGVENANVSCTGYDKRPWCVRTGQNSGFGAIHIAMHFRPARIVLCGFDYMKAEDGRHYHHGGHVNADNKEVRGVVGPDQLQQWADMLHTLVEPAKELGIEIVNASPRSAVTAFPHQRLDDIL